MFYCRLPIADSNSLAWRDSSIGNWQSEIGNKKGPAKQRGTSKVL